jgi:type IV pilus assembly protein PilA
MLKNIFKPNLNKTQNKITKTIKKGLKAAALSVKKGFSLIELMIVIAIIGILAMIAISQYTSYVARAQFSEAVNVLGGTKTPVSEFFSTQGRFPINDEFVNIAPAFQNLTANTKHLVGGPNTNFVTTSSPQTEITLEVTFRNEATSDVLRGNTVSFHTNQPARGSRWVCFTSIAPANYSVVPAQCRFNSAAAALAAANTN